MAHLSAHISSHTQLPNWRPSALPLFGGAPVSFVSAPPSTTTPLAEFLGKRCAINFARCFGALHKFRSFAPPPALWRRPCYWQAAPWHWRPSHPSIWVSGIFPLLRLFAEKYVYFLIFLFYFYFILFYFSSRFLPFVAYFMQLPRVLGLCFWAPQLCVSIYIYIYGYI